MKTVAIIFLALFAMSFAQDRVRVADGPAGLNIADNAFYRPTQQQGGAANVRPDNDAFYSQAASGYPVRPSFGPAYVNYPPKPQQNPLARGGK